ncbi:MAG: serine hydrolase domain-containing protein [Pseudomonadota bacterium]
MTIKIKNFSASCVAAMLLLSACSAPMSIAAPIANAKECAPLVRNIDTALAANIDAVIDDALGRGFAGGVAILQNDIVVYSRTVGSASLSENIPVTDETLFHVASITKYFTAALVLRAVEEGLIALDDPIAKYAPDMKLSARGVTIEALLLHRSGLGSSYVAEQESDRDAALAAIDNAPFDPEKMGRYNYSNDGYDVLGILLERIYGRDYEDLLREKILTRACLERPRHWSLVDLSNPTVISQPLAPFPPELINRNYGMVASAGLLITAEDLAAYQWALANGKVLSAQSIKALFTPRAKRKSDYATFGGFWREHDVLGPRLSARGYEDWGDNAIMNHYLDKDVIVVVVTSRGPADDTGARPFRSELSAAIEILLSDAASNEE